MTFLNLDNLKSICSGTWLARPEAADRVTPSAVSIDSRTIKPGELFIAIKGERTDGHQYLKQVFDSGAACAIIERADALPSPLPPNSAVLQVADAGQALLRLAAAYRKTLETTKVIAVGGSNGKTTTTRLIQAVLSRTLRGTASPKSFNNAVGVPLTILAAKRGDAFLLCEVGTNAPGEIATLTAVVQPDIAVITRIGREHLEGLGSLRGVINEEVSLLGGLRPGGLAVINADPPELEDAAKAVLASRHGTGSTPSLLTFGIGERSNVRVVSVEMTAATSRFTLNDRTTYSLPLLGEHNASNAAAAIAVARRLGIPQPEIEAALASAKGPDMRLQRETITTATGDIRFLNDAYNANPDSMLASLQTFDELFPPRPGTRRVLILGDMYELGEATEASHREIGAAVREMNAIDLAICIGTHARLYADQLRQAWTAERIMHIPELTPEAIRHVAATLRAGDAVLLKASRRLALERIVAAAKDLYPNPSPPPAFVEAAARPVSGANCAVQSA
jgi:UDP-N-acetylmuramoyl-tripeptide--D-alanyl-D-alanine ligase